jgi:RNase P/RNase MRP subunit POP5
MKSLKPSMRENKRYLLLSGKNLKNNVPKLIKEFIGVLGVAKSAPKFIEIKGNKGILSVNRKSLDHVKSSFALYPEKVIVERVSGTLKGLKKKHWKSKN